MHRVFAIIERELRRLRRSPMLIFMSLTMPMMQLMVLGHAYGGTVKNLKVALIDQDHGMEAVRIRELSNAIASGPKTFDLIPYDDQGQALAALKANQVNGVLTIPEGFSRRTLAGEEPSLALIVDNTDGFSSATLAASTSGMLRAFNTRTTTKRLATQPSLEVVEVYPFVPYVQFMLPGSIVMSIFMMVMIGGGIIYLDDKARGLHEGYLVTPITKFELICGFTMSGAIKAAMAGLVLMTVGSVIAGVPNPFEPLRLLRLLAVVVAASVTLVSMMFLLMVRLNDPLAARAMFGVLNTLLYFPSGAIYPQQAFPPWLRAWARLDPFTYPVHALKSVLLKNTGFAAIGWDMAVMIGFSAVAMTLATMLFKREL